MTGKVDKELSDFLRVLRRAMRQIRETGDTRRGLRMIKAYLDRTL